ncbi:MAG TPA: hypothetical protein VGT08_10880 [Terracidiphilus sp.]|nr:hypothetical protein [Terracidiphilus sp.]
MQPVKYITVAVTPELYHQTRMFAVEYNSATSSVTPAIQGKIAISACTAVNLTLNLPVSEACEEAPRKLQPRTQYATNQDI